jgi:hypothetical protein
MTWAELKAKIEKMTDTQQNTNVTIYDIESDEFFKISDIQYTGNYADILDPFHPYFPFDKKG